MPIKRKIKQYTLDLVSSENGDVHWMYDNENKHAAPTGEYVRYDDYSRNIEHLNSLNAMTKVSHKFDLEKLGTHRDFYSKKWDESKVEIERLKQKITELQMELYGEKP